jgi:hypothetical protein
MIGDDIERLVALAIPGGVLGERAGSRVLILSYAEASALLRSAKRWRAANPAFAAMAIAEEREQSGVESSDIVEIPKGHEISRLMVRHGRNGQITIEARTRPRAGGRVINAEPVSRSLGRKKLEGAT